RGRDAFAAQSSEHTQRAAGVAVEQRIAELENVEARAMRGRLQNLRLADGATRLRHRELRELLLRREQVALDSVGQELGGFGRELKIEARGARFDPSRQLGALDGPDLDNYALPLEALYTNPVPRV